MRTALLMMIFLFAAQAQAGQALTINLNGDPVLWSVSSAIALHPESGECGQYTNAEMLTLMDTNLDTWTNLSFVVYDFSITGGSISGVDGCNYTSYLAGVEGNTGSQSSNNVQDGLNPILFDNDGEIVDAATGVSNGRYTILGFANPAGFSVSSGNSSLYTAIVDGQALFNCYCLDNGSGSPAHSDCGSIVFSTSDLDFTMIHEMGHFMNLDHTQLNSSLVSDGNSDNDDDIPTMYPQSVNASKQKTPMEDDHVAMASLYPTSDFFTAGSTSSNFCKVTGTLLDSSSREMRCADVQMIDSADDSFSLSFTSGAYAPATDDNSDGDTADSGECDSGCGNFQFFLRPGRTYALKIKPINSSFTGGSGISPCVNSQLASCPNNGKACVKDETLTTNAAGETISTKITNQCTAGATVALGNIVSNSTSILTASALTKSLMVSSPALSNLAFEESPLLLASTRFSSFATSCPESAGSGSSGSSKSSSCSLTEIPGVTVGLAGRSLTVPFAVFIWVGAIILLGTMRFVHKKLTKSS